MSRQNSNYTFSGIAGLVNGLAVIVTISLISTGYISALGSFAGIA